MKKAKFKLPLKYNPDTVEADLYQWWVRNGFFKNQPHSGKTPYTILLPPPNITGKLHLGHAWDGYLEDAIIRYKKLKGYDTLFIPGMDHAGIATQIKVEAYLREEKNINRLDLAREDFIEHVWSWKNDYTAIIRNQWEKLGLSLNYDLEKFTLDKNVNQLVNYVFVHLYKKGLIYRHKRIVNWDPVQKTAISNIEVVYKDIPGSMYYFRYPVLDSNDLLEVATTRPETMFSDQALVVNPNDERYKKYIGKKVINPVNQQKIPVIADEYVDQNFGTGVMKVTPAHDFNDFEIGKRHNLKMPKCMNDDGTMNERCGVNYVNLSREEARELIIKTATKNGSLYQVKPILHAVGFSERSNAIVEPFLSDQWFIKMDGFAKEILKYQNSEQKVNFIPSRFNQVLAKWLENSQDWTISRQLWWGHQIPAWYHKKTHKIYVNTEPPKDIENWIQDPDVLDTWFSSGLWPLVALQWKPNQGSELFNRYYPTNVLVTGYDIIFFWVARMMFQSFELVHDKPFENVLVHGLIRDQKGRKMSKSLNNGIDPMSIINKYGSDALRFSLLTGSTPGQDLKFNEKRIESSWNFFNKLWNISQYVFLQLPEGFAAPQELGFAPKIEEINIKIWGQLGRTIQEMTGLINNFDLGMAGRILYDFVWNIFASNYIEQTKVVLKGDQFSTEIIEETRQTLFLVLKNILILIHPYAPFVSDFIYQKLGLKPSVMLESWPKKQPPVSQTYSWIKDFEAIRFAINAFRLDKKIPKKEALVFTISHPKAQESLLIEKINVYLRGISNAKIEFGQLNEKDKISLPVNNRDYFLEINHQKKASSLDYLFKEKNRLEAEINRSQKILNNPQFQIKANPQKIALEKEKYQNYQKQWKIISLKLKEFKNN